MRSRASSPKTNSGNTDAGQSASGYSVSGQGAPALEDTGMAGSASAGAPDPEASLRLRAKERFGEADSNSDLESALTPDSRAGMKQTKAVGRDKGPHSGPLRFSGVLPGLFFSSFLLLFAASLLAVLVFSLSLGDARYADSGFWIFKNGLGLSQLVEFATNACFPWIFEPVVSPLLALVPFGYELYTALLVAVSASGFAALLRWYKFLSRGANEKRSAPGRCEFFGFLAPASALLLFGLDTPFLSFIAVLPWFIRDVSFLLSGYRPGRSVYFRFAAISVFGSFLANQLSVLLPLVAFASVLSEKDIRGNKQLAFVLIVGFAPAILRIILLPAPIFPELGKGGHVVPALGLLDRVRPLFGSEPDWASYNWARTRTMLRPYSIFLAGLSFLFWVLSELGRRKGRLMIPPGIARIAFLLTVFVLLDTRIFAAAHSEIFPVQAFSRLLPEFSYLPLGKYLLGLSLVLLPILGAGERQAGNILIGILFSALLVLLCFPASLGFPPLLERASNRPLRDFLADEERTPEIAKRLFSPSYAVFRAGSYSRLRTPLAKPVGELQSIGNSDISFGGSGRIEDMPLAFDGDLKTRWANGTGRQEGHERFEIRFHNGAYRKFREMKLALGPFVSDFPRGFRVQVFEPDGTLCESVERNPWEGPIEFNQSGFPYFGYQQDVQVRFSRECTAEHIILEQLGQDKNFDWSIAEILIR